MRIRFDPPPSAAPRLVGVDACRRIIEEEILLHYRAISGLFRAGRISNQGSKFRHCRSQLRQNLHIAFEPGLSVLGLVRQRGGPDHDIFQVQTVNGYGQVGTRRLMSDNGGQGRIAQLQAKFLALMPEAVGKIMKIRALAFANLILLTSCGSAVSEMDYLGVYAFNALNAEETVEIVADGTYRHLVKRNGAILVDETGYWRKENVMGKRGVTFVGLQRALGPEPKFRGYWFVVPVESRAGKMRLYIDESTYFEQL
jgi:hypothetical protein